MATHLIPGPNVHYIVPTLKKVYMTVWFLANREVFRSVGNLFGMPSKGTAHYCIMEIYTIFASKLRTKYICWPDRDEQKAIAD